MNAAPELDERARLHSAFCILPSAFKKRSAFTLTEILIVIALIVLFITLALPAFNLISGSRSIAGATNEVSAFIGQARMQAIGLQETYGVGFYVDAATNKSMMCLVYQPMQSPNSAMTINATLLNSANGIKNINAGTYVYDSDVNRFYVAVQNLPVSPSTTIPTPPSNSQPADDANWSEVDWFATDAAPDTDFVPLPAGVGAQLINDSVVNTTSGAFSSNHYVSFGAILFDGTGTMVSKRISIAHKGVIGQRMLNPHQQNLPIWNNTPTNNPQVYSQVGVVLFDLASYTGAGGSMSPQSLLTSNPPPNVLPSSEAAQESWLDHNSTPLLINRYNGTLIRSE